MKPTLCQLLAIATLLVLFGCGNLIQESPMKVKVDAIHQLKNRAGRDNFAENGPLYTGVRDPVLRAKLNSRYDLAIGHFVAAVERKATKNEYLALLTSEIKNFERAQLETEDAEQVGNNFEHIMECIGLESSEGILNVWMYSFDPKKL